MQKYDNNKSMRELRILMISSHAKEQKFKLHSTNWQHENKRKIYPVDRIVQIYNWHWGFSLIRSWIVTHLQKQLTELTYQMELQLTRLSLT